MKGRVCAEAPTALALDEDHASAGAKSARTALPHPWNVMNGGAVRPVADSSVVGSSASIAEVKFGRAGSTPARRSATEWEEPTMAKAMATSGVGVEPVAATRYVGIDWAYRRAAWCALSEGGAISQEGAVSADEDGLAKLVLAFGNGGQGVRGDDERRDLGARPA
jgi:hypothetical protein